MPAEIPSVIMRGGTSKAVFLKEQDLPSDEAARDRVVLSIFGSPDKRQIDGLGGADPLTSKLAVIAPPSKADGRPEHDLVYTFGQVEINEPNIDYHSLCGNISAAVGAFGVYERMVAPTAPLTTVRVFNTNLERMLTVEVPVEDGKPLETGDYEVPGVPGRGARINVNFADTAGATTGALLPTGNPVDILDVPGFGKIECSLVDIGNAHVFIRAADVKMRGTETPQEIDKRADLCDLLERIRGIAAHRMGMISEPSRSRTDSPATPILGIVSAPADYENVAKGETVTADGVDIVSRLMFMQQTHKTYAGTSTACTGVASRIPGTVVFEATRPERRESLECRIGHPAGVIVTETRVELDGNNYVVKRATLGRTARRIMQGTVFVPDAVMQGV